MNVPFFRIGHLHSVTAHLPALSSLLEILKPFDWQLEDGYTMRRRDGIVKDESRPPAGKTRFWERKGESLPDKPLERCPIEHRLQA